MHDERRFMAKTLFVGLDRDGTINVDVAHLGRNEHWKEQTVLLPSAALGIKKLKQHQLTKIIVATNQAGVAHGYLTLERVNEVNTHIDGLLQAEGAHVDAWYACPYVTTEYAREHALFPCSHWIKNNGWRKPGIGMLRQAAEDMNTTLEKCLVYFVGDRKTDVEAGINAGGKGIFIHSLAKEYIQVKALEQQHTGRIFCAHNLVEVADIILDDLLRVEKDL